MLDIKNFPINKKLAFLIIGISGFILLITSIVQVGYGVFFSLNSVKDESNIIARVVGQQSMASLEFFDQQEATKNLSSLNIIKDIHIVCLYDELGSLFSYYINENSGSPAQEKSCPNIPVLGSDIQGDHIITSYEIVRDEQTIGVIYIERGISSVNRFVIIYGSAVAALFVCAILLAYMLSSRFQAIISGPISHLVNVTNQLTQNNDYSIRASKYGEDELGTLVDAFNNMVTEIQNRDKQLHCLNEELEATVNERTKELQITNDNLLKSLNELHQAQDQLIQSEKLSSLAGLVAGVAHEINTPIGVGVTSISHLSDTISNFKDHYYNDGNLSRAELESFIETADEATHLVLANLKRSADLVRSFKQIAVDQSSDDKRSFRLKNYIEETLVSLKPKLNKTSHSIILNCSDDREIYSYPGAFSQIITNLVINSIFHGFEDQDKGEISLGVDMDDERISFFYSDNGKGIPKESLLKIFDPFYTTKRGEGGSGLGMNIVYNLVTQKLGGTIECRSEVGVGTMFMMKIPMSAKPQHHY